MDGHGPGHASPGYSGAMRRALLLAATTAVLRHLLENELARQGVTAFLGGDAVVSVLPPDRIPTGAEERAQVNVFLYQVAPNAALGSRLRGGAREGPPPLALDLYYLVTAYGAQDLQAEVLLGHVVQVLHERPVLPGEAIRAALAALVSRGGSAALLSGLDPQEAAEAMGELRITPHFGAVDDLARVWSALQAGYRPSVAYRVTLAGAQGEE